MENVRINLVGGIFMLKEFKKKVREEKAGKFMGKKIAISKLVQTSVELFAMLHIKVWELKNFQEYGYLKKKMINFISENEEMKSMLEKIVLQEKTVDDFITLCDKYFTVAWVKETLVDSVQMIVEEQQELLDAAVERGDVQ